MSIRVNHVLCPRHLDAEGLTGLPQKTVIDKMHAYRDAVRREGGEQVIEYAVVLYPGPSQHFGDDVVAIEAVGGCEAGFQMELEAVLAYAFKTSKC